MIIKNILPRHFEVLLDGKKYSFPAGSSMEVSEREASYIMMLQPLLVAVKEEVIKPVVINSEPSEIEKPKAKKNVVKNKKPRK